MFRTTYKTEAILSRRPIELLGSSAKVECTHISLEVTVAGSHTDVRDLLTRTARIVDLSDLTGWFPEPFFPLFAVWLDGRIRSSSKGVWIFNVAVVTPDGRYEYTPD